MCHVSDCKLTLDSEKKTENYSTNLSVLSKFVIIDEAVNLLQQLANQERRFFDCKDQYHAQNY
jgi:hypothetical protein